MVLLLLSTILRIIIQIQNYNHSQWEPGSQTTVVPRVGPPPASRLLSPGLRGRGGRHGRGWGLLGARAEHGGEHGGGQPRQQRGRDAEGARQQRHRGDADPLQLRLLQPLGLGAPVLEPDLHLKKISSLVMWFYNNPITPSLKVNLDTYLFSSCCIFRLILPTPSLHRGDKQWAVTRLGTIVTVFRLQWTAAWGNILTSILV